MLSSYIKQNWLKIQLSSQESIWDWDKGVGLSDGHIWMDPLGSYALIKHDNGSQTTYKFGEENYRLTLSSTGIKRENLSHVSQDQIPVWEDQPEPDQDQRPSSPWRDSPWQRDWYSQE